MMTGEVIERGMTYRVALRTSEERKVTKESCTKSVQEQETLMENHQDLMIKVMIIIIHDVETAIAVDHHHEKVPQERTKEFTGNLRQRTYLPIAGIPRDTTEKKHLV